MDYTFDSVLQDDVVTVVTRDDEKGTFVICIGVLKTHVTIELGRYMVSDETKFQVSHVIMTPVQIGPYHTSLPFADSPVSALNRAVGGLTSFYRQAVEEGHEPSEDWLVRD